MCLESCKLQPARRLCSCTPLPCFHLRSRVPFRANFRLESDRPAPVLQILIDQVEKSGSQLPPLKFAPAVSRNRRTCRSKLGRASATHGREPTVMQCHAALSMVTVAAATDTVTCRMCHMNMADLEEPVTCAFHHLVCVPDATSHFLSWSHCCTFWPSRFMTRNTFGQGIPNAPVCATLGGALGTAQEHFYACALCDNFDTRYTLCDQCNMTSAMVTRRMLGAALGSGTQLAS